MLENKVLAVVEMDPWMSALKKPQKTLISLAAVGTPIQNRRNVLFSVKLSNQVLSLT